MDAAQENAKTGRKQRFTPQASPSAATITVSLRHATPHKHMHATRH